MPVIPNPPAARSAAGALAALGAACSLAVMGSFVHGAVGVVPAGELMFLRGLFAAAVLAPAAWPHLHGLLGRRAAPLWIRSAAGAASMLCYFWTLQRTGIATARALTDMAPAFLTALALALGWERPAPVSLAAVAAMTAAAVSLDVAGGAAVPSEVVVVGLLGAVLASVAYLALRQSARSHPAGVVVFVLALGMMIAGPLCPGDPWVLPAAESLPAMTGVVTFGLLGQLLLTRAFALLSASIASALTITALLWSVLLDALVAGRVPTPGEAAAYAVIMVGAVVLHRADVRQPQPSPGTIQTLR